jgi:hypothetical protein
LWEKLRKNKRAGTTFLQILPIGILLKIAGGSAGGTCRRVQEPGGGCRYVRIEGGLESYFLFQEREKD